MNKNSFTDILNYFIVQQEIRTKEWFLISSMKIYQDAFEFVENRKCGDLEFFKLKYAIIYYDYLKDEYIILEKDK